MKKQKSSEEKALKDVNAYLKKFTEPLLPSWQYTGPLLPPYFPRHGNLMDRLTETEKDAEMAVLEDVYKINFENRQQDDL